MTREAYQVPAGASIGHVHLHVADLERSLAFYRGVLGFGLVTRFAEGPHGAAFVSAGGYHHHIGLNTWRSRGASPPPPGHTGLYHFAVRYPARRDLAEAVRRAVAAGVSLHGATDHGVSHSIYLADPDGNGLELTWDLPRDAWPLNDRGEPDLFSGRPLDVEALLAMPGEGEGPGVQADHPT